MTKDNKETRNDMLAQIDKYGWFSQGVFDPDGESPDFRYSIGMSKTLGSPEFIVIGVSLELMHNMLWEVFRQVSSGKLVEDGAHLSDLLEGFDCVCKQVHPSHFDSEYFFGLIAYWNRDFEPETRDIYQIVWPGALSGDFPRDDACDPDIIEQQPHLWLPAERTKSPAMGS